MANGGEPSHLVDMRGIGKPPSFTGDEKEFTEWKFRFEISMSLLGIADNMRAAEERRTPILPEEMSEAAMQKSKMLFAILAQVLTGKALALLRLIQGHNGFEGWRIIVKEFQPDSNLRTSRMLSGALNPKFSQDLTSFAKELLEWELMVQRYDAQSGTPLQDNIKIAVLVGNSPGVVQQWLMHTEEFEVYSDLRLSLMRFLSRHSRFDQQGSIIPTRRSNSQATPMDVDMIDKGHGKGKFGKSGKGFGKGYGKNFGDQQKGQKGYNGYNGSNGYNGHQGYGHQNKGKGKGYKGYGNQGFQSWNHYSQKGSKGKFEQRGFKGKGKSKGKGFKGYGFKGKSVNSVMDEGWYQSEESGDQGYEDQWSYAEMPEPWPVEERDNDWTNHQFGWNEDSSWENESWYPRQWNEGTSWDSSTQDVQNTGVSASAEPSSSSMTQANVPQSVNSVGATINDKAFVLMISEIAMSSHDNSATRQTLNIPSPVMNLSDMSACDDSYHQLLIDSGSFLHVCRPDFGTEFPLRTPEVYLEAVTASGDKLVHYGDREVSLKTRSGHSLRIMFHVMNVQKNILSLGKLSQRGHELRLNEKATIHYHGSERDFDRLEQSGMVWYLPVQVETSANQRSSVSDLFKSTSTHEVHGLDVSSRHKIYEWCCEPDSRLTASFVGSGHEGVRFGLPEFDCSVMATAILLLQMIMMDIQVNSELIIWLWIALPCTFWSTWQHVNMVTSEESKKKILLGRRTSLRMIRVVKFIVDEIERMCLPVHICFEWPKNSIGWNLPEIHGLVKKIPHMMILDGCRYGVVSAQDRRLAVRKPWRIQTTCFPLSQAAELNRVCDGSHRHAQCRGPTATMSGRYPPKFARAFTRVMFRQTQRSHSFPINQIGINALGDDEFSGEEDMYGSLFMDTHEDENEVSDPVNVESADPGPSENQDEDPENPNGMVDHRIAKELRVAKMPSKAEVDHHNLTHLPFQRWCKHCIQRASDDGHYRDPDKHHSDLDDESCQIQMDYSFIKTDQQGDTQCTVLLMWVTQTLYGFACRVPRKGANVHGLIQLINAWLQESGLTKAFIRCRADNEKALLRLVDQIIKETPLRIFKETGATRSSSSIGGVSRYAGILAGMVRTLLSQLKDSMGISLMASHPMMAWCVRHACWLLNRFSVRRATGLTPFEATKRHPYRSKMVTFGFPCWLRIPGAEEPGRRIAPRWIQGLFLGRDTLSDENIGVTNEGIMRSRSLRCVTGISGEEKTSLWDSLVWTRQRKEHYSMPVPTEGLNPDSTFRSVEINTPMTQEPAFNEHHASSTQTTQTESPETRESGAQAKPSTSSSSSSTTTKRPAEQDSLPEESRKARKAYDRVDDSRRADDYEDQLFSRRSGLLKRFRPETEEESVSKKQKHDIMMVSLISVDGPPWYDSVDGSELDEGLVEQGMQKERNSLRSMDVYEEIDVGDIPSDATVINSRWVLRQSKTDKTDGTSESSVKGRIVAQQLATEVLDDVYTSTSTTVAIRLLLCFSLFFHWVTVTGDVSTAFLHALIPYGISVFIKPPVTETRVRPRLRWKLKRALYGLRHAPKWWGMHLKNVLVKLGWTPCRGDPSLYFRRGADKLLGMLSVHTDDILMTGEDVSSWMKEISSELKIKWSSSLTSVWKRHLGRDYMLKDSRILVKIPEKYYQSILDLVGMRKCRKATTPNPAGKVPDDEAGEPLNQEHHKLYRGVVGKLMWAINERPDLNYAVKELARRCSSPTLRDWKAMEGVLRYLKSTEDVHLELGVDEGFIFDGESSIDISVMTDASWSADRSTSGGVLSLGGFTLASWSRTQAQSALSSCESEFYALTTGVQEALFIKSLLGEMFPKSDIKLTGYIDSTSAAQLAQRTGVGRLKHLDIRLLWIQDLTEDGTLKVHRVHTDENTADLFTKHLGVRVFSKHVEKIGIRVTSSSTDH